MSDVSDKKTSSTLPSAPLLNDCMYASCYCEENVYKLIGTLVQSGAAKLNDLTAVVISNTSKQVGPLLQTWFTSMCSYLAPSTHDAPL